MYHRQFTVGRFGQWHQVLPVPHQRHRRLVQFQFQVFRRLGIQLRQ